MTSSPDLPRDIADVSPPRLPSTFLSLRAARDAEPAAPEGEEPTAPEADSEGEDADANERREDAAISPSSKNEDAKGNAGDDAKGKRKRSGSVGEGDAKVGDDGGKAGGGRPKKSKDDAAAAERASIEIDVRGNEGRVIGKGGETVRHLESTYGVKIDMKRDRGVAIITGRASVLQEVKRVIEEVIEKGDSGRGVGERKDRSNAVGGGAVMGGGAFGGGFNLQTVSINYLRDPDPDEQLPAELKGGDPDETIEIQVPCPGKEGRVIGKGGATIKEISRQSGADCAVKKGSGVCDIKGTRRCVVNARRAVLDQLALQVDRFVGMPSGNAADANKQKTAHASDWQCPACAANVFGSKSHCFACGTARPALMMTMGGTQMGGSMMMPMGGSMMMPMGGGAGGYGAVPVIGGYGMTTGGYAMPGGYGGYPMSAAVLGGTGAGQGSQANVSVEVPCRGNEGRVIGKGGEMIKYIQTQTNTKLDLKRDQGTVMITGSSEAVAMARGLILEVIENGDTRDKGGLVASAYANTAGTNAGAGMSAAAQQHPSLMGGQPVMVAAPMPQAGGYPAQAQGGYYAQPGGVPAGYPQYTAVQLQGYAPQGAVYDPAQGAAQAYGAHATASAEWGSQVSAGQQQAVSMAPPVQQQGEWQTHYSEGRAYYYNVATGETRWA